VTKLLHACLRTLPFQALTRPIGDFVRTSWRLAQLEQEGNFRGLVQVLEDAIVDDASKANAARALGNLASGNNDIKAAIVAAGAIPLLMELLRDGSDLGKAMAAGALANLSSCNNVLKFSVVVGGSICGAICGAICGWRRYGSDEGRFHRSASLETN
jgi:hypothetical protein